MAHTKWIKDLNTHDTISIAEYNEKCNSSFSKVADIVLNIGSTNAVIKAEPVSTEAWKSAGDHIYILVRNGLVMKIGGTRTPMNKRWGSYLCGHYTQERGYDGKMSVTNAYIYHTIEDTLHKGDLWEIWAWKLPVVMATVDILGEQVVIPAQVYHAYESKCIELFRNKVGKIPQLCNNSDPAFRKAK